MNRVRKFIKLTIGVPPLGTPLSIQLVLVLLVLAASEISTFGQTIRIADNNVNAPTGALVYSTLQAAINAASSGDVIYVMKSPTAYEDGVTINKPLTLLGIGFNTGLSSNSTLGSIIISSSNVKISGCNFYSIQLSPISPLDNVIFEKLSGPGSITVSSGTSTITNLVIRNCYVSALTLNNAIGSKIYNNILSGVVFLWGNIQDNLISNNLFFYSANCLSNCVDSWVLNITPYLANSNTSIFNNLFSGTGYIALNLGYAAVNNNIFYGIAPGTASYGVPTFTENSFNLNLSSTNSSFPPGATTGSNNGFGNISGVSPVFVNAPLVTAPVLSYDYSLNAGSPAKNAGSDNTDIGPTGGAYPISKNIVFGPSAVPLITNFNTSGAIPQNVPLKANVKAKGN